MVELVESNKMYDSYQKASEKAMENSKLKTGIKHLKLYHHWRRTLFVDDQ